ncbi:MAG: M3 family oligoendopeptidase [Methanobacteriota archaeon]
MADAKNSAEGVRWNLNDIYKGLGDPQIDKDIADAKRRAEAFEKAHRGKLAAGMSPADLLAAVKEYESIYETIMKPAWFSSLLFAGDTSKTEHGAFLAKAREKMTDVRKHLLFFELEWCALDDAKTKKLIDAPELRHYSNFLKSARRFKPHLLSEAEEKIMDAKRNTGRAAFVRYFDETLGSLKYPVTHNGKTEEMSLEEALSSLYSPDRELRIAAHKGVTETLKANVKMFSFVFNIVAQDHGMDDGFRKYPDMMSKQNLDNQVDDAVVNSLIDAVGRHRAMVARYYKMKRQILGLDKLYDYDRYCPVGIDLPKCTYEEGKNMTLDAYGKFSPKMREVSELFFDKSWIDAEIRPGKEGGAFCSSAMTYLHPYVLLNWTETVRDAMTMAHELGHGIHAYVSRGNGFLQSDTPLTAAETASVFGEMVLFEDILSRENDPKAKLGLLCGKIEDSFATVFRQIMMVRFERRFHEHRRAKGELTVEEFNRYWTEENVWMFGDSVEMTEDYSWWWTYVIHFIHYNFYTYAYSFGNLLVLALYDRYKKEGPSFAGKFMAMLEAGGSLPTKDLVAKTGLNITDPKFWDGGLKQIEEMVAEAEKLAKAAGMAK